MFKIMWLFLDFIRVKSEVMVRFLKVGITISIFLPKMFSRFQSHKKFASKHSPIGKLRIAAQVTLISFVSVLKQ